MDIEFIVTIDEVEDARYNQIRAARAHVNGLVSINGIQDDLIDIRAEIKGDFHYVIIIENQVIGGLQDVHMADHLRRHLLAKGHQSVGLYQNDGDNYRSIGEV